MLTFSCAQRAAVAVFRALAVSGGWHGSLRPFAVPIGPIIFHVVPKPRIVSKGSGARCSSRDERGNGPFSMGRAPEHRAQARFLVLLMHYQRRRRGGVAPTLDAVILDYAAASFTLLVLPHAAAGPGAAPPPRTNFRPSNTSPPTPKRPPLTARVPRRRRSQRAGSSGRPLHLLAQRRAARSC